MMDKEFTERITYIEGELRRAGYDPYEQLSAFVRTQDERYITRSGDARRLILELELNQLTKYVSHMKP